MHFVGRQNSIKELNTKYYDDKADLILITGRRRVGKSPAIENLFKHIEKLRGHPANVLLMGETGVGKELIARRLNEQEGNIARPFISVNCASIPEKLMESTLFGHEKGAFTDAFELQAGKFELANGGDIFLDEISSIPSELQGKLLRVLQEKEVERVGSNRVRHLSFRVISATNQDLEKLVAKNLFREDLYYRINTVQFEIPPLRERASDIPLLVSHFMNGCKKTLSEDAMELLLKYQWPGNVRELEHIIEGLTILSEGDVITIHDLPKRIVRNDTRSRSLIEMVKRFELDVIESTLKNTKSMREAARVLGVSPATISLKARALTKDKNPDAVIKEAS